MEIRKFYKAMKILVVIFCFMLFFISIYAYSIGNKNSMVVLTGILSLAAGVAVLLKKGTNYKKLKNKRISNGRWNCILVHHTSGLPIASGLECKVHYKEGFFQIDGAGNSFVIKNEKITDISVLDSAKRTCRGFGHHAGVDVYYHLIITYKNDMGLSYVKFRIEPFQYWIVRDWKKLFEYEKNNM